MEGLFIALDQRELSRVLDLVASKGFSPDSTGVRAFLLAQAQTGSDSQPTHPALALAEALAEAHPAGATLMHVLKNIKL